MRCVARGVYRRIGAEYAATSRQLAGAVCRSARLIVADGPHDFVIIGATPAAALLAGLLAHAHGKRVLRVAPQAARQRLSRHLDLALPLAARPDTWALIQRGVVDIRTQLVAMGALDAMATTAVSLHPDTVAGREFIGHVGHVAKGFGLRARIIGTRWDLGRVPTLQADLMMAKMVRWLASAGVETVDRDAARLEFGGGVPVSLPTGQIEGAQIVLADDDALLELPEGQRPPELRSLPVTVTLTARTRSLAAPVGYFPERGIVLTQQPQQHVLAIAAGENTIDARIASALPGPFPLNRLATSRYRTIETVDGAPLIGRASPSGVFIAAGLGDAAAFAMPAIARHLAGIAEGAEATWLASHSIGADRSQVAEFAP